MRCRCLLLWIPLSGLLAALPPANHCLHAAPSRCCPPQIVAEQLWTGETLPFSDRRWLLADDRGGVYGFWLHDWFQYSMVLSRDSGDNWSGPSDPTGNGRDVRGLDAEVNADGSLVVAYVDDNKVYARASQDQGASFGQRTVLADHPDTGILGPILASGPGDVFAVGWTVFTTAGGGPDDGYYVAVSEDAGLSWGAPFRVSDPLNLGSATGMVIPVPLISSDAVLVVVSDSGGAVKRSLATRSTDGGRSWSGEILVTASNGTLDLFPSAYCHTSDGYFLVGHNRALAAGGDVFEVAVSQDHGISWTDAGLGFADELRPDERSFTCSRDGRVTVAWFGPDERPRLSLSDRHGLPGSWRELSGVSAAGVRDHHFRPIHEPFSRMTVFHDDYRDENTCGQQGTCESIYADRSCDGGQHWLETETRVDEDASPNGTHSEDPEVAHTPDGRMHALWTDHAVPIPGSGENVHYVGVEVPEAPRLWIEVEQTAEGTLCDPPAFTLHARIDPAGGCPGARIEWWKGELPLPGAVGPDYVVPTDTLGPGEHAYSFVAICSPPLPCGDLSPEVRIEIPSPESRVVGTTLDGTLRVAKTAFDARVFWNDADPDPSHHNLYRGTIGSWYDHETLDCHVPRSLAQSESALGTDSYYYLLAPADCGGEGETGTASNGTVRPVAGRGAPCGPVP